MYTHTYMYIHMYVHVYNKHVHTILQKFRWKSREQVLQCIVSVYSSLICAKNCIQRIIIRMK